MASGCWIAQAQAWEGGIGCEQEWGLGVCAYVCIAKLLQSCLTLCDPMDCSPPGSSVHGDSPAKNAGVGCHFLLQGNLPDPGMGPTSFMSPAFAGGFFTTRATWEAGGRRGLGEGVHEEGLSIPGL